MTDSKRPLLSDEAISEKNASIYNGDPDWDCESNAFNRGANFARSFYEAEVQRYERELRELCDERKVVRAR